MIDKKSEDKAKRDWATQQAIADRRFQFDQTKRAHLAVHAKRITVTVETLERLELLDRHVFGPQPNDGPGRGHWPF